ncbi:hypothetical protein VARIO8X_50006 [Burkholderiales bacterium 8X]|nr:hypothetical protein VARIO8X_50006 [Burkholderiales bacterium 8X]
MFRLAQKLRALRKLCVLAAQASIPVSRKRAN